MIRKCSIAAAVFVFTIVFFSCAPVPKKGLEETRLCKPADLRVESLANNYAKVAWNPGCPGIRVLRGFNIYLSPNSLATRYPGRVMPGSVKPFNTEIYPGDAEGRLDRETYELENIKNATRYYVHVRAVYNDGSLSIPSNELDLVVFPQGTFELDVSYTGEQAGFSLAEGKYCRTDALENDLYYYHKDGIDYICSPSRIGPVNRSNTIYAAGSGIVHPDPEKLKTKGEATDRIAVAPGQNLLIQTEEGYWAGLYISGFEETGQNRVAKIEFIYKPPVEKPVS